MGRLIQLQNKEKIFYILITGSLTYCQNVSTLENIYILAERMLTLEL